MIARHEDYPPSAAVEDTLRQIVDGSKRRLAENGGGIRRIQIADPASAITGAKPDPKISLRSRVNDVASLLSGLVKVVEGNPEAFTADDVAKIEAFLHGRVERAVADITAIIRRDPGVASHFDFDMPLPSPQSAVQRHPHATAQLVLPMRARSTVPSVGAAPTGRLVREADTPGGLIFDDPLLTSSRSAEPADPDDASFLAE